MIHTIRHPRQHGFTLLEVLSVCALIAILAWLILPTLGAAKKEANRAKCATNLRQIGLALQLYTQDHNGNFPPTTHTTGSRHMEESWIYGLATYLDNIDEVRVCPADPAPRQEKIRSRKATSYSLNELVFDREEYRNIYRLPRPTRTLLAVILSENRSPSTGWDHVHCSLWSSWQNIINDVEVDRHRVGSRAFDRLSGSANYLYADGHVANLSARELKKLSSSGINPGDVPL
jgi:prepilin-type processing-associated H-X9-DG protein/prepilin-type N-terminal cleavage/methylation domain-containing protein